MHRLWSAVLAGEPGFRSVLVGWPGCTQGCNYIGLTPDAVAAITAHSRHVEVVCARFPLPQCAQPGVQTLIMLGLRAAACNRSSMVPRGCPYRSSQEPATAERAG